MGTINYCTSDYITLGIEPMSAYDLEQDSVFMEELQEEINKYGGTIEDAIYSYIADTEEEDRANIESELEKHNLIYYHITIKPGYYEGFHLDIESNYPLSFDSWEDKREAQKEITEIKQLLLNCVDLGLRQVFPGWCTTYKDRETTILAVHDAVKDMREEARQTPTWRQYERETA